jgi:hypothetical protein
MQPKAKLTLSRGGDLTIEVVGDDTHQCGTQGVRQLRYHVELDADETALDARGFVVDQLELHAMLVERFRVVDVMRSCELMCIEACRAILFMCPKVQRVKFEIGTGGKGMCAVMEREPQPDARVWVGSYQIADGTPPQAEEVARA